MSDIQERLRVAVDEVNKMAHTNGGGMQPPARVPLKPVSTQYDFEQLGTQVAAGMVQAASELLTAVQNLVAQTQAFADDIAVRVQDKARELNDMHDKLKTFGTSIVDAHKRFHGDDKQ